MANAEERQLEDIIVSKVAPKRVEDKESRPKKAAKLTSRTIASLRTIIRENRLEMAYDKYNRKYQKMKSAAIEAVNARDSKIEGQNVADSQLAIDYSIVASYDKKLAKLGAKLLKNEIKTIAANASESNKAVVGKRIKVPRFLLGKMKKITDVCEKVKSKIEQNKLTREITKETREYIKSSLDGALFKEDGTLREEINSDVIKNLGLKGGPNDTESRLDTLKEFISLDGKTSIFSKGPEDEELEKETKPNTDLPPVEPTSTVIKEEPKIDVNDLLKGFSKKEAVEEKEIAQVETVEKETKPNADLPPVEPTSTVTKEEPKVESERQEVLDIITRAQVIEQLNEMMETTTEPEEKAELEEKLLSEKEAFEQMIKVGTTKQADDVEKQELQEIVILPKEEKEVVVSEETTNSMANVEVKKPEAIRVEQVAKPFALRVTLQDIKNLEERNKNAQMQIEQLRREKEELESQKAMLKEYIEQANITREAEEQARSMAESNDALKGEVAQLSSQVAEIQTDLVRAK